MASVIITGAWTETSIPKTIADITSHLPTGCSLVGEIIATAGDGGDYTTPYTFTWCIKQSEVDAALSARAAQFEQAEALSDKFKESSPKVVAVYYSEQTYGTSDAGTPLKGAHFRIRCTRRSYSPVFTALESLKLHSRPMGHGEKSIGGQGFRFVALALDASKVAAYLSATVASSSSPGLVPMAAAAAPSELPGSMTEPDEAEDFPVMPGSIDDLFEGEDVFMDSFFIQVRYLLTSICPLELMQAAVLPTVIFIAYWFLRGH